MQRRKAIMALGAAAPALLAPGLLAPAAAGAQTAVPPATAAPTRRTALAQALVLSGGGALGAYEAGVIATIVAQNGVREGEPLRPYELICGASIGAFNAYLVATGQYAKLSHLWDSIATQNVVRPKPQYAKIRNQSSGVITRFAQDIALATGLAKDVTGVFDGNYLRTWLSNYFDFSRPIIMPMFWSVTNLTDQRAEYFYIVPEQADPANMALAVNSVRLALGANVPVRAATRELLIDQIRASAAVPVAFDPVPLPGTDGEEALYVDGGVTANTPLRVATALALRVDAVLLNPPFEGAPIRSGLDVAIGSFSTMQRQLMENAIRSAYFESFALQALRDLPPSYNAKVAQRTGISLEHLQIVQEALYETSLYVLRPAKTLPSKIFGFDDAASLAQTYAQGRLDGAAGFTLFDPYTAT